MAKGDFVISEYDRSHNLERKLVVLDSCLRTLEEFQKRFAPFFDDDPMINGHLERLRADMAEIRGRFGKMRQIKKRYRWHSGTAPQEGVCAQCGSRIPAGSPFATLDAYGKEYWFCRPCAEAMLEE